MTTDPPTSRRDWHFTRWLIVLIVAMLGWGGWRAYAFRSALSQAKALGWEVDYAEKETRMDGVTFLGIPTGGAFEQHVAIVHVLNPKRLQIYKAAALRDLSVLKPLSRLQQLYLADSTGLTNLDGLKNLSALQGLFLNGCTGLKNVDGLKNLSALEKLVLNGCAELPNVDLLKNLSALNYVWLNGCTGLTNVDALKNLAALREVYLYGCTGLKKESVAGLKAALPKTTIIGP